MTDKEFMTSLMKDTKFDYIFHLAAIASVQDSVERPVYTHEVNFESVLLLLELIRKYQNENVKRLLFSSSAAVFGDEPTLPKKEESVIRPLTPYAVDKFAAERYVLNYSYLYGLKTSAVRFFNVYGPKQNPASPYSGVISIIVSNYQKMLAGLDTTFKIFGDGQQSRDFIYVSDVVRALHTIVEKEETIGEVYNIGTGNATTLNQLIETMDEVLNVKLPVVYKEGRPGDIKDSLCDNTKLTNLGFSFDFDIQKGISDYLKEIL